MEPTPFEIFWKIFYRFIRIPCQVCGYDILDPSWKGINWNTRVYYFIMVLAMLSMWFTVITYPIDQKLIAAALIMMPTQGVLKFYTYLKYSEEIKASVLIVQDVYKATSDSKKPSYPIMLKWSTLFLFIIRIFYLVIFLTMTAVLQYPLSVYILTGEAVPMMPMYVPGIDETTKSGFIILTLIHIGWDCQAAIGVAVSDIFYSLILLHIWPLVELFESMFEQMNEAILESPKTAQSQKVKMWIRNLVLAHQEICA